MENQKPYRSKRKDIPAGHHPNEVYVLRDWKEYIGESLLIVFSVLLALGVTEVINYFHERSERHEMLVNIKDELIKNRHNTKLQYAYQTKVLATIDSALKDKRFQQEIVNDDHFFVNKIAPEGIMYKDLDDVAWQVAKSHNIASKVSINTMTMFSDIYDNQARIVKLEDEAAHVLLAPESRNPANAHLTLTILRDEYKGWSYERTPSLIKKYDEAIKLLEDNL
ncbi:hypothetical protein [Mucilaginibacter ginkgonis]|uniref:Uncharacterized protein n=1 Tax=Mucilaginibacter ginkgonis TaxID=2682091 RepID=A0A6I4I390_9SPHI|nr:hypothetical protein [Mucilaginibacter ginkgonis]QQL49703.1 hypothetical protein GO620_016265 [Mucilaginibacter ginkgonis]